MGRRGGEAEVGPGSGDAPEGQAWEGVVRSPDLVAPGLSRQQP
jgi:hypothetical protein